MTSADDLGRYHSMTGGIGFVAGAAVVAILGTHRTPGIDAATFGMSALIALIGVRTPLWAVLPRGC